MKVIIEKELCDPVNGEIVGPLYHIYKVDEETGKKELIETVDGNIGEAARVAERTVDFNTLEIAYYQDPNCFSSVIFPIKEK